MIFVYPANLVRCVDGDTVRLVVDVGFYMTRNEQPYRLLRINAPEMSTPEGPISKAWLEQFLAGKALTIQTFKSDSFGRFLAEVWANAENVSDALVAAGKAVYKTY